MSAACICRTAALRLFVRSVADAHLPNDGFIRAPWHETPRQIRSYASWSRNGPTPPGRGDTAAKNTDKRQPTSASTAHQSRSAPESGPTPPGPLLDGDRMIKSDKRKKKPRTPGARHDRRSRQAAEASQKSEEPSTAQQHKAPTPPPDLIKKIEVATELSFFDRKSRMNHRHGTDSKLAAQFAALQSAKQRKADKERNKIKPLWAQQKEALKKKFPEGWKPRKKLSPDAINGVRALNRQFPRIYTTEALAERFEMSPESIRRILRTRWEPSPDEEEDRQRRWLNRGKDIWEMYAQLGKKPPRRWRDSGIEQRPWGQRKALDEPRAPDGENDDFEYEERLEKIQEEGPEEAGKPMHKAQTD